MLDYKAGVVINKDGPLKPLLETLDALSETHGEIVITSGNDGRHAENSYHYHDRAVDIRSWNRTPGELHDLVDAIREECPVAVHVRIEVERLKRHHYWYAGIWRPIGERGPNQHIHIEVRE